MEPRPLALGAWSLNYGTTRKVPKVDFCTLKMFIRQSLHTCNGEQMFPGMAGLGKGEHMFPVGEELAVWMENEEGMNHAGACGADLLCAKNLDTPYLISS